MGASGQHEAGACPDEEALLAYLEAGLGGAPALEAHLDGCERCRQVVAALGPLPLYGEGQGGESGTGDTRVIAAPAARASGASTTLASARSGEENWDGRVLAGKYRVLGELGRGGMGVVLEAEHVGVSERFAIKLVRAEGGEGGVKRLMREAKLAAQVGGRHVARVYDVGSLGDGRMFLVMERLYGEDLQSALRRRGALPVDEAVGYVVQACEAVGRAHAAGVIHRDLKPANLFLSKEEGGVVIKVLDFGLAKLAERPRLDDELSLTTSATIIGSPRYMSPEQIRDARGVDERSDVWSIGVILFEMLAGEPPFSGTTISGLWASIVADPPRPLKGLRPEAPAALVALVEACLAKDPRERPQSVAELARRVREASEQPAGGAPSRRLGAPASGQAAGGARGGRRYAAALSVVAALGLASAGVVLSRGKPDQGAVEEQGRESVRATASAPGPLAEGGPLGATSGPHEAALASSARGDASALVAAAPIVASAAPRRFERGRGSKEAGQRVHGAASVNDVIFGKETDSRH